MTSVIMITKNSLPIFLIILSVFVAMMAIMPIRAMAADDDQSIENGEVQETTETEEAEPEDNRTIEEKIEGIEKILLYICGILLLFLIAFAFKWMYKFFSIFF